MVHVRDAAATTWDGNDPFYSAVDQPIVDAMVLAGLQQLTGQSAWSDVWEALFTCVDPAGYAPGRKIAIKVNLNNSKRDDNGCTRHNNKIDALPQPIIGLISGLVAAGVQDGDVIVYDATGEEGGRLIPAYFRDPIHARFANVTFIAHGGCPGAVAPSYGKDPSLTVHFHDPDGNLRDRCLADLLYDAAFLIDIPILKAHTGNSWMPVTLAFKNHLGSVDDIVRSGEDNLHYYMFNDESWYDATYSPLVDIYANTHIRAKTALILGDGLFGAFGVYATPPSEWDTFGGASNSLFFATDPVAIDCVMADFIVAEGVITKAHTYDTMFCAAEAGLGVCEGTRDDPGGDPWLTPYGSGYQSIRYARVDL